MDKLGPERRLYFARTIMILIEQDIYKQINNFITLMRKGARH